MKNTLLKLPTSSVNSQPCKVSTCIGQIVDITEDYRAKIDYPGNPLGPVIARSVIQASDCEDLLHSSVILIFENGDPALPIIVGLVQESIFTPNNRETFDFPKTKRHDVALDGRRIVFKADTEIVLRCGISSITLKSDGKVVVKGENLVSRASAANKLRGSSVKIN